MAGVNNRVKVTNDIELKDRLVAINRVEYKAINLDTIQKLAEAKNLQTVGINDFIAAGFISSSQLVKVLGNGTLTAKLDVQAHAFSKTAVAAIEAAGGQVVKL